MLGGGDSGADVPSLVAGDMTMFLFGLYLRLLFVCFFICFVSLYSQIIVLGGK